MYAAQEISILSPKMFQYSYSSQMLKQCFLGGVRIIHCSFVIPNS